jgi:hypothetical protein
MDSGQPLRGFRNDMEKRLRAPPQDDGETPSRSAIQSALRGRQR